MWYNIIYFPRRITGVIASNTVQPTFCYLVRFTISAMGGGLHNIEQVSANIFKCISLHYWRRTYNGPLLFFKYFFRWKGGWCLQIASILHHGFTTKTMFSTIEHYVVTHFKVVSTFSTFSFRIILSNFTENSWYRSGPLTILTTFIFFP